VRERRANIESGRKVAAWRSCVPGVSFCGVGMRIMPLGFLTRSVVL
jgi:hypothetical protein